ncbi:MAG: hypothetical protein SFU56_10865 [Capsulimonadales bacterium]|nr:hypothetical protein [Capsulimonadales bacterium]
MPVSRAVPVALLQIFLFLFPSDANAQVPALPPVDPLPATPASPPPTGQNPVTPPLQGPTTAPRTDARGNAPPVTLDAPARLPQSTATEPATPVPERNLLIIENADRSEIEEDRRLLSGNVRLRYNGYHVASDRAVYQPRRRLLTFEGRVVLNTGQQIVYADGVTLNTRTREFTAREARTIIPTELLAPNVLQPVLLQGRVLERKGDIYTALDGVLTTCDFPNPHYKVGFRQADFIPNNRIVLRDSTLYRYQTKIVRIRYLVIPVRETNRASIPPNVGRTEEEGYFIKFGLNYLLSEILPGLLRFDLMEKKGIGVGFDQAYRLSATGAGVAALYSLNDRNRGVQNLNGRFNHQQYIGDTTASLTTEFQNNSYQSITADSKNANSTLTLTRNIDNHDTNLSVTQTSSDYTNSRSGTTTYTLTQTEQFGGSNRVTLRLNGSDTTNRSLGLVTTTSGRTEQSADLQANLRMGIFDTVLKANRNLKLTQKGESGGSAAFSGTQRLPDLSVSTESDRFGKSGTLSGFLRRIPASYSLGYGRFLENVSSFVSGSTQTRAVTTGRFLFGFTPRDKTVPLTPGGNLSLQLAGNFQQTVYREDAAQYILTGRSNLVQRLGDRSTLNFAYNYLRPYGGSPLEFRLDQTGTTNNLNANLTVETYRTRLSLVTGYDILEARSDSVTGVRKTPWQNLALQLGLRPSPVLQTRFTTAYDINTGTLLDVTNRTRIRGNGGFALDTGIRFDPRRYRFPQITEVLTVPLFSRDLKLSALTGYNGVTYRFDYKQFYLTQSFHDYELLFSYVDQRYGFRTERGFNVAFRLKAFPALRPQTTGQYGTPLDTGTGESF